MDHLLPDSSKDCRSDLGKKSTYQASELEPEYPVDRQLGRVKRLEIANPASGRNGPWA
jgi:hypothetical protein